MQPECTSDPSYNTEAIRNNAVETWQEWRSGLGRHVQGGLSTKFCKWWAKHYEECLIQDGLRVSYEESLYLHLRYATPKTVRLAS